MLRVCADMYHTILLDTMKIRFFVCFVILKLEKGLLLRSISNITLLLCSGRLDRLLGEEEQGHLDSGPAFELVYR